MIAAPISDNKKRYIESLIAVLCFLIPLVLIPWQILSQTSDFFRYYLVSLMMQNGQFGDIYNPQKVMALERVLIPHSLHGYFYFLNPPIISWLFYPLAWLSFNAAMYLWLTFSVLVVLLFCWHLCDFLNITGLKKIWILALIASSGPYLESIRLCQLAPFFLCGLIILLVGFKTKNKALIVIGQSVFLLKPNLILPTLFFELGYGYTSCFIFTCLIAIVGLLISVVFGGIEIIPSYVAIIQQEWLEKQTLCFIYEPTFIGQMLKVSIPFNIAQNCENVLFAALSVLAYVLGKQVRNKLLTVNVVFTVLVPLSICFSLHSHNYDLLLLVPGLVLLSRYSLATQMTRLRSVLVGLSCFTFLILPYVLIHYFYVLKDGLINPFFWLVLFVASGSMFIEKDKPICID